MATRNLRLDTLLVQMEQGRVCGVLSDVPSTVSPMIKWSSLQTYTIPSKNTASVSLNSSFIQITLPWYPPSPLHHKTNVGDRKSHKRRYVALFVRRRCDFNIRTSSSKPGEQV